jgi:hypothetical protein
MNADFANSGVAPRNRERSHDVRQVLVRYKVKPEYAARNEDLVRRVYDELHQVAPAGIRYGTFALEDGVSFVHVASFESDEGNPLMEIAAFRAFSENIEDRCDEPPQVINLREIGAYGLDPSGVAEAVISR